MSNLVLGWQVNSRLEPRYWASPEAKRGGHSDIDLFRVAPVGLGAHTAIIAQSGSGKSFFLGRLVEEIVLRTKGRCLIFDPNADFRRIHEVESDKLWTDNAPYNLHNHTGKLTHEHTRAEFARPWSEIASVVRVGWSGNQKSYKQLQLSWPAVSADFLGEDLEAVQRIELYHCHEFVKLLHKLLAQRTIADKKVDYLTRAERLLSQAMSNSADFISTMRDEFLDEPPPNRDTAFFLWPFSMFKPSPDVVKKTRERLIEQASSAAQYVSLEVKRYYFGRLAEFRAAEIIDAKIAHSQKVTGRQPQIEVLDLPSLSSPPARLLAMSAMLATEWDQVRAAWNAALEHRDPKLDKRAPTFVVVDEAHNVVPYDARSKPAIALREQFRTIVAEGRKYGLFLVLVSQRPDKLDPLVVSECENRAVMRMSSAAALDKTREMLGLGDIPHNMLAKCLDMPIGRALLAGPWSPDGPEFMYAAARRTVEGGRNLRVDYWGAETLPAANVLPSPKKAKRVATTKKLPTKARRKRPTKKRPPTTT
jgi:hypothetical protein